ncbi:hypothetical protein RhiirA1_480596 [Rhizophagus irregularis]|uniref:Uncharacterized protein n=1 Tax=Rhizophagus irregularis TaxID=588596 RepID=A0A2N0QP47_9GLOM|nr:hypothetical protein RhiirA1_480596 [Rhizophagus irregularis]
MTFPANLASTTICSTSFFPACVALREKKGSLELPAIAWAIDVLPIPGSPYKSMEGTWPFSIILNKAVFSPIMCCWPTTSRIFRGRIRNANGSFCIVNPP